MESGNPRALGDDARDVGEVTSSSVTEETRVATQEANVDREGDVISSSGVTGEESGSDDVSGIPTAEIDFIGHAGEEYGFSAVNGEESGSDDVSGIPTAELDFLGDVGEEYGFSAVSGEERGTSGYANLFGFAKELALFTREVVNFFEYCMTSLADNPMEEDCSSGVTGEGGSLSSVTQEDTGVSVVAREEADVSSVARVEAGVSGVSAGVFASVAFARKLERLALDMVALYDYLSQTAKFTGTNTEQTGFSGTTREEAGVSNFATEEAGSLSVAREVGFSGFARGFGDFSIFRTQLPNLSSIFKEHGGFSGATIEEIDVFDVVEEVDDLTGVANKPIDISDNAMEEDGVSDVGEEVDDLTGVAKKLVDTSGNVMDEDSDSDIDEEVDDLTGVAKKPVDTSDNPKELTDLSGVSEEEAGCSDTTREKAGISGISQDEADSSGVAGDGANGPIEVDIDRAEEDYKKEADHLLLFASVMLQHLEAYQTAGLDEDATN